MKPKSLCMLANSWPPSNTLALVCTFLKILLSTSVVMHLELKGF